MTTYDFSGRTVIVTGAARGIGKAVSAGFAAAGASVVMADIDAAALEAVAEEAGGTAVAGDIAATADVENLVERAHEIAGRIDIVVNNAGLLRDKMLWKTSDEDWEAVVGVSLGGTFKLTRACVPHFRRQGYGRVINVTSYTGLRGNIGQAAYGAAKAGVIGFTKTAAKELARFGITVNAISPNANTRMTEGIPDEHRAQLERQTPLGRFGETSEIVSGVQFLASEEAAYITGVVLPIDGGISI